MEEVENILEMLETKTLNEAKKICGMLGIDVPRICIYSCCGIFGGEGKGGDIRNRSGDYDAITDTVSIYIYENTELETVYKTLAHELRHKWQHEYKEEIFLEKAAITACARKRCIFYKAGRKYLMAPNPGSKGYLTDRVEIDAEAYARRYMRDEYNWSISFSSNNKDADEWLKLIEKRIGELDADLFSI
jgi:hypothetical protein